MSSEAQYRALKGMRDILPPDVYLWQWIEKTAREIFSSYGFLEIKSPVVESTSVFTRSIGENTDIVEKEMYTFEDKAGRSISLRPEGTASIVRCYVENRLFTNPSPQKFYYAGPMFRYERPQSGRFRQFYQIGVEAFGSGHAIMDAEVISMLRHLLSRLGLPSLNFQVNSIGCEKCRPDFKDALRSFFSDRLEGMCDDCRRRYVSNPLRIIDCKVPRCVDMRMDAPKVTQYLCSGCRDHFEGLLSLLDGLGVPYSVNPNMVRGLDYYTRTTFEVTSEGLGAQNAVAAGGRYDRLVGEFGGPDTQAVGFAIGMERIAELIKDTLPGIVPSPDLFIVTIGKDALVKGMQMCDGLRVSGIWVELGEPGSSVKSQMRRADKISAGYVFILGDEELATGTVKWKRLVDSTGGEIPLSEVTGFLRDKMKA